jgi:hypothetical protein
MIPSHLHFSLPVHGAVAGYIHNRRRRILEQRAAVEDEVRLHFFALKLAQDIIGAIGRRFAVEVGGGGGKRRSEGRDERLGVRVGGEAEGKRVSSE